MSLFTWFYPQASTIKQKAVAIEYVRNSLKLRLTIKQSKTGPLLQGVFGVFSYFLLVILILNVVCLTVVLAYKFL
jgi:hypothetical protein